MSRSDRYSTPSSAGRERERGGEVARRREDLREAAPLALGGRAAGAGRPPGRRPQPPAASPARRPGCGRAGRPAARRRGTLRASAAAVSSASSNAARHDSQPARWASTAAASAGIQRVERVGRDEQLEFLVGVGAGVHAVSVCPVLGQKIAQARERRVRARLDRAERLAEALGQLRLRQARRSRPATSTSRCGGDSSRARRRCAGARTRPARSAAHRRRRRSRAARRSGARAGPPRAGRGRPPCDARATGATWRPSRGPTSNRAAPRQTARNPSCTASSASDASRTIRRASP